MIAPCSFLRRSPGFVDAAAETAGADRLLAELGAHLVEDGLPLAGGALTLEVPHPLIARRTWLWRAASGEVIEALGFAPGGPVAAGDASATNEAGRRWLAGIAAGVVHQDAIGSRQDGPSLSWIGPRPFSLGETDQLRQAARFAAAPLAVLAARATLTASLEAYLGRRSAARVLAAPLRRDIGETIQAALLFADLRDFTALSESNPPDVVISALNAWFDRIAGAVHAFGGEVLKFIGDGLLAIFPVVGGPPRDACSAALRAVSAARAGMAHLDQRAAPARAGASAVRRRAASRRDAVGQYWRRRSPGFHGDRPRRQSGEPVVGAVPAAREGDPHVGRARRRDRSAADRPRNARAARDRIPVRRLHPARSLNFRQPVQALTPSTICRGHRGDDRCPARASLHRRSRRERRPVR